MSRGPHVYTRLLDRPDDGPRCLARTALNELLLTRQADEALEVDEAHVFETKDRLGGSRPPPAERALTRGERRYALDNLLESGLRGADVHAIVLPRPQLFEREGTPNRLVACIERPSLFLKFNEEDFDGLAAFLTDASAAWVGSRAEVGCFWSCGFEAYSLLAPDAGPVAAKGLEAACEVTAVTEEAIRAFCGRVRAGYARLKRVQGRVQATLLFRAVFSGEQAPTRRFLFMEFPSAIAKQRELSYTDEFVAFKHVLTRVAGGPPHPAFGKSLFARLLDEQFRDALQLAVVVNLRAHREHYARNFALLEFTDDLRRRCGFDDFALQCLLSAKETIGREARAKAAEVEALRAQLAEAQRQAPPPASFADAGAMVLFFEEMMQRERAAFDAVEAALLQKLSLAYQNGACSSQPAR